METNIMNHQVFNTVYNAKSVGEERQTENSANTGVTAAETLSLNQVKRRFDVTHITPKQIDELVNVLRDNNLASFEALMTLSTHGYEFRSHLPGNTTNQAMNLIAQTEQQLDTSRRHGSPTELLEKQLTLLKSLLGEQGAARQTRQSSTTHLDSEKWLDNMLKNVLDSRMGVDRKKLKEIEEKIEAIANDPSLSDAQKATLIETLEEQKQALIRKMAEEAVEMEKQRNTVESLVVDTLTKDKFLSNSGTKPVSDIDEEVTLRIL